jgi:cobalt/nickel transport system permease protein
VASRSDPRRDRRLLVAWLVAAFALSAIRDPAALGGAGLAALVLLRRGATRNLLRTLRTVVPVTAGLAALSAAALRLVTGAWPAPGPYLALALRAAVLGFLCFSVLDRVDLLRALAPYPTLSRLLVVTLAQIHALRLLVGESRDGLRSRLPRRPGALDVLRNAGGITAVLLALAARNARDVSDAMRSRGF